MDTNDETVETTAVDHEADFDAAFMDASGDAPAQKPAQDPKPEPTEEPKPEPTEEPETEPTEEPKSETEPTEEPKPEPKSESTEEPKPEPAAQKEAPQQQLDPKYLAQAIAEAQREAEQRNQQPAEQAPKELTPADFLEEADVAAIKRFETEWPDEYAAVQKLVQAELRAALGNSFNNYTKQLNGVLAPLMGSVQKVEVNTYRGAVTAAHPDAFEIAPKVAEWIETQPTFVRDAYKQAYEKGTAQEAIELLNLYKAATGPTGAAPATPASSAAQEPKPKPEVSPKAVKALAAVPAAQRPKPIGGADALDFDAAFAEATGALANS